MSKNVVYFMINITDSYNSNGKAQVPSISPHQLEQLDNIVM